MSPSAVPTDRAVTWGSCWPNWTSTLINMRGGAAGPIEIELNENRGELQLTVSEREAAKVDSAGFRNPNLRHW
jgi:hypothetical protein